MPTATFNDIAAASFALLNVFIPGQALPPADATYARQACNRMLGGWAQRSRYIPVISRNAFAMTTGQGGPSNPYTIGPGGNFNVARPVNQNSIKSANLILTTTTPNVRVRLGIYSDQAYDANQIPDLSNTQPTGLYYNPTYASGLGSIFIWPVPSVNYNQIELFLEAPLVTFTDNTTSHDFPEGADDAIIYQLALRLQGAYGKQMGQEDRRIAMEVLDTFKRSNAHLMDLQNDAAFATYGRRTLYNINTGSGG